MTTRPGAAEGQNIGKQALIELGRLTPHTWSQATFAAGMARLLVPRLPLPTKRRRSGGRKGERTSA